MSIMSGYSFNCPLLVVQFKKVSYYQEKIMSYAPYPGLPLITAATADNTYGPFIQGNIGTFNQRKPAMFTVSGVFGGATVAVLYSVTPTSTKYPLPDECENAIVFTAPTTKAVKNLAGGVYLWLQIADASGTTSVNVSLGFDNPTGFLGDTDTTVGEC